MRKHIIEVKNRSVSDYQSYLHGLQTGHISYVDFQETQLQFSYAALSFTEALYLLTARWPSLAKSWMQVDSESTPSEQRLSLFKEHSYLQFLEDLDLPNQVFESRAIWPEVEVFQRQLHSVCTYEAVFMAVAMMSIIEDIFSELSLDLQSFHRRAQLYTDKQVSAQASPNPFQFQLSPPETAHQCYQMLAKAYEEEPVHTRQIQQGLELGAYLLGKLFQNLFAFRKRRWIRQEEVISANGTKSPLHISNLNT
mgnify:CR=1 FL=1